MGAEQELLSQWFYEILSIDTETQTCSVKSITKTSQVFDNVDIKNLFGYDYVQLFSKEEYQAILVQQFIQEAAGV